MNTASEMYIAFLHLLRHQNTTSASPFEFNQCARRVLLIWLEEVRTHYDKHEKVLEAANSLVERISIAPVNNEYPVPYQVANEDENAYILHVAFEASGCVDKLQGIRLRENKNNNRYNRESNWEVHYNLESNTIIPEKISSTIALSSCHVLFLKFPNIIELDGAGLSVVNSNLPSHINSLLVDMMVKKYLEINESARIQTFT